jgi:hypothetical protein
MKQKLNPKKVKPEYTDFLCEERFYDHMIVYLKIQSLINKVRNEFETDKIEREQLQRLNGQ